MVDDILLEIEKINKERIDDLGDIWGIDRLPSDLKYFIHFILKYFDIEQEIKEENDFDYAHKFLGQKTKYFNYIEYLLDNIKPYLLLALKLSQRITIDDKSTNPKLKEDSIVNIIKNFERLNRTGRKRRFHEYHQQEFKEFKLKYSNVINYYKKTETFDGVTTGSIIDYAKAIREFNISKEQLYRFLSDLKKFDFIAKSSRATKYRFDREFVFIYNSKYNIKRIIDDYDLYNKALDRTQEVQKQELDLEKISDKIKKISANLKQE